MSRTLIVTRAAEADILDGYRSYEDKWLLERTVLSGACFLMRQCAAAQLRR